MKVISKVSLGNCFVTVERAGPAPRNNIATFSISQIYRGTGFGWLSYSFLIKDGNLGVGSTDGHGPLRSRRVV